MAQEARVTVNVDTADARREMDRVNDKMAATKERGAQVAGSIRRLASAAAAGVAGLGAAVEVVSGPGVAQTGLGAVRDIAGSTGRSLLGGDPLSEGMQMLSAHQQAVQATQELVGAGGQASPEDMKRFIREYREIFEPGVANREAARRAGQDVLAEEVAQGDIAQSAIKKFDEATEKFDRVVSALGRMFGGG